MPYKLSAGKLSSDLFFYPDDKKRRVKNHNTNAAFVIVKRKRKSNISLIVTDSVELFLKKQTQKRKLNNSGKR